MPVGLFALSMLEEPMAHETIHIIKSLPLCFSKTNYAKKADGEASNKYANLQSEYAGNLAKIKTLKRRMDTWDMISPYVIPDFIDPYALSVEDCWGDRKLTGVNLFLDPPSSSAPAGCYVISCHTKSVSRRAAGSRVAYCGTFALHPPACPLSHRHFCLSSNTSACAPAHVLPLAAPSP